MSQAPSNFKKTNVDNDPVKLVAFSWDAMVVTESGFALNALSSVMNSAGSLLSLRPATFVGWRLFRGTTYEFEPQGSAAGDGNCIKDEVELTAGVLSCTDNDVPVYGKFYYKLAAIFQVIGGGYGETQYGNGNFGF